MHDQAENLRNRLKAAGSGKQGKTVSIVSGKGGVGKSNVAINFSLALVQKGKKVLVIDFDIGMGNIDILLGRQSDHSIRDLFTGSAVLQELIEEGPHGLHYISGGSGLAGFLELEEKQKNNFFIQYEGLIRLYDYVIFDMGAGATRESIFFILASDECILVSTPEPTALTDAYGMVKQIINNSGKMPIHILMNRSASPKIGKKALDGLKEVAGKFLKIDLKELGVLPEDPVVHRAVMHQTPYLLYNEKAAVSLEIKRIAAQYLNGSGMAEAELPETFLGRLKQLMRLRGGDYGHSGNRYR